MLKVYAPQTRPIASTSAPPVVRRATSQENATTKTPRKVVKAEAKDAADGDPHIMWIHPMAVIIINMHRATTVQPSHGHRPRHNSPPRWRHSLVFLRSTYLTVSVMALKAVVSPLTLNRQHRLLHCARLLRFHLPLRIQGCIPPKTAARLLMQGG